MRPGFCWRLSSWLWRPGWAAGGLQEEPTPGRRFFTPALPLALLLLILLQSAFTVSDLFITHFALLTPLVPLIAALSFGEVVRWAQGRARWAAGAAIGLAAVLVVGWAASDAYTVVLYHRGLTVSGGYSAHSDAIYQLAAYLDKQGYKSPVALDWGIDAPVRFLTEDRVQPVDVFGYDRLDAPDEGFMTRLTPYLDNPDTIYIAPPPAESHLQGTAGDDRGAAREGVGVVGADTLQPAQRRHRLLRTPLLPLSLSDRLFVFPGEQQHEDRDQRQARRHERDAGQGVGIPKAWAAKRANHPAQRGRRHIEREDRASRARRNLGDQGDRRDEAELEGQEHEADADQRAAEGRCQRQQRR